MQAVFALITALTAIAAGAANAALIFSRSRKAKLNGCEIMPGSTTCRKIDGKEKYTEAVSGRDADFVYKVGEMVSVDDFCKNRWEECAAGIHFFMNRKEAVDYWL